MKTVITFLALSLLLLFACGQVEPERIKLNEDKCHYCKMAIADPKFAAELITTKGRIYKFDDVGCMLDYAKETPKLANSNFLVADFENPGVFLDVQNATFVRSDVINSPMGGNMAAFANKEAAERFSKEIPSQIVLWTDL